MDEKEEKVAKLVGQKKQVVRKYTIDDFPEIIKQINSMQSELSQLRHYINDLHKEAKTNKKKLDIFEEKQENRKKKCKEMYKPKFKLSKEMSTFLGTEEASRNDILTVISQYITGKGLNKPEVNGDKNGCYFVLDDKLSKIIAIDKDYDDDEATQFKYILKKIGKHLVEQIPKEDISK